MTLASYFDSVAWGRSLHPVCGTIWWLNEQDNAYKVLKTESGTDQGFSNLGCLWDGCSALFNHLHQLPQPVLWLKLQPGHIFNPPSSLANDRDHLSHSVFFLHYCNNLLTGLLLFYLVLFWQVSKQSRHSVENVWTWQSTPLLKISGCFPSTKTSDCPLYYHPFLPGFNSYISHPHAQQRVSPWQNSSQAPLSPFSIMPQPWPIKTWTSSNITSNSSGAPP